MKRSHRLIVLSAVVIIALLTGLVPVAARSNVENISFEYDENNDGIPDGWKVDGRIDYLCDQTATYGSCYVLFLGRARRASIYQSVAPSTSRAGNAESRILASVQATNLDKNRAYMGFVVHYKNGAQARTYGAVPGGNYRDTIFVFGGHNISSSNIKRVVWGVQVLPGMGKLSIDRMSPY